MTITGPPRGAGRIITTVVGTGVAGYSGDGGPATEAQLFRPADVRSDRTEAFYIADFGNSRVRRVGPDGIITTVAALAYMGTVVMAVRQPMQT